MSRVDQTDQLRMRGTEHWSWQIINKSYKLFTLVKRQKSVEIIEKKKDIKSRGCCIYFK